MMIFPLLIGFRVKVSPTGGGSWWSCPHCWMERWIRTWMTSPAMTSWWRRYKLCANCSFRQHFCFENHFDIQHVLFILCRNTRGGESTLCAQCFTVRACSKSRVSPSSSRSASETTATSWTRPASRCRPPPSTASPSLMVRTSSRTPRLI